MRAPLNSLTPALCCFYYWLNLIINIIITIGANFGFDYWFNHNNESIAFAGSKGALNVLLFTLICGFFTYWGPHFGVVKSVQSGSVPPVKVAAMTDTLFKRIALFSLPVPTWQNQLPRYLCQTFVFPGLFIVAVVNFFCWLHLGCKPFPDAPCAVDIYQYCCLNMIWKGVGSLVLYTVAYLGSLVDTRKEFAECGALVPEEDMVSYRKSDLPL